MNLKIGALLFLMCFICSCAPVADDANKSSVTIKFPKSNYSTRSVRNLRTAQVAGSSYGVTDIASLNDIDCYVVAIGFIDGENSGSCGTGADKIPMIQILSETVEDGGQVSIDDVPVGPERSFYVIGYSTVNGTCLDFKSVQFSDLSSMSRPVLVGVTTQGLIAQAENFVNITISMTGAKAMNSCRGLPFNWETGDVFDAANFDSAIFGP